MKKHIITITLCLFGFLTANAQNVNLVNDLGLLDQSELDAVTERIIQKVDDFQVAVQDLARIGNMSVSAKQELSAQTIKLFIGDGKPYHVKDLYGRDTIHSAVTMSTISSKYKGRRTRQPMVSYLQMLVKRSMDRTYRYKKVIIEAADAVRVDNLSKVGDGRYIATAHILQHFVGFRGDGMKMYEDYTAKTITIYINRFEQTTPDGEIKYWDIKLGDIDCNDIW